MDPEANPLPDPQTDKPCGGRILAAMLLAVVIFIAIVWIRAAIRIPTADDAEKVFQFHTALVKQLERRGLTNLKLYTKPWSGGRGDIILKSYLPPEKLEVIKEEFDRLNVNGAYELKLRAPWPAAVPPPKEEGVPSIPLPSKSPAGPP